MQFALVSTKSCPFGLGHGVLIFININLPVNGKLEDDFSTGEITAWRMYWASGIPT